MWFVCLEIIGIVLFNDLYVFKVIEDNVFGIYIYVNVLVDVWCFVIVKIVVFGIYIFDCFNFCLIFGWLYIIVNNLVLKLFDVLL